MTFVPPPSLVPDFAFLPATPEAMEQDPLALAQGLASLGDRLLLTLKVPTDWAGQELNRVEFFAFQLALAHHSGTLAFIQTQHQSAASFIANGDNALLKAQYLFSMAMGQQLVGVGFSHLRRTGQPGLTATPSDRGYRFTGVIPWLTGWGIFQDAVIAATLPDGHSVWGILPLRLTPQVQASNPMPLAAMSATQTVRITLQDYELRRDRLIDIKPPDWIRTKDQQGVLNATALSLGAARAALDLVQQAAAQSAELLPAYATLDEQWCTCHQRIMVALTNELPHFEQAVQLRGAAIALAGRCAQAAVTVSRGAANHLGHAAQRIYREVLVFTVSGQTAQVRQATLEQIAQGGGEPQ